MKVDDLCVQALNNRIAITIIGIGLNELANPNKKERIKKSGSISEVIFTRMLSESSEKILVVYLENFCFLCWSWMGISCAYDVAGYSFFEK